MKFLVPEVGLEPTSLAAHAPKACEFTNFSTRASFKMYHTPTDLFHRSTQIFNIPYQCPISEINQWLCKSLY